MRSEAVRFSFRRAVGTGGASQKNIVNLVFMAVIPLTGAPAPEAMTDIQLGCCSASVTLLLSLERVAEGVGY